MVRTMKATAPTKTAFQFTMKVVSKLCS